ncbi:carbonic anhydrase [Streptomyces sp. NPDC057963]|uniref:carbonic anhydrase n=1 Tax=Streptomyces sp. NPDC057963 TaxID=3346290 RepID=UPI0036E4B298
MPACAPTRHDRPSRSSHPPRASGIKRPHSPPPRGGRFRIAGADLSASITVFLLAVPMSLGLAVAMDAPLEAGLISAAVGGIVAGLLGGTPLQVSGPSAGLTVVTAELIQVYGWRTTCAITIGAGLLQILLGSLRAARSALAVSPAIVHGTLAGIGVAIALAQLHIVLGGSPQSSAVANTLALPDQLERVSPAAPLIGVLTIAVLVLWPRIPGRIGRVVRRIPAALAAVVTATAMAALAAPGIARVDLPSWRSHALPEMPHGPVLALATAVFTVMLVASLESLLAAVAVDKLSSDRAGERTATRSRSGLPSASASTVTPMSTFTPVSMSMSAPAPAPAPTSGSGSASPSALPPASPSDPPNLTTTPNTPAAAASDATPDGGSSPAPGAKNAHGSDSVPGVGPAPSLGPGPGPGVHNAPDPIDPPAATRRRTGGNRLFSGLSSFQRNTAPLVREELARLAREGQRPSQLFITCADSRLVTSMITASGPGDLFTVRNIGNLVPLPDTESGDDSVGAAIEYAVDVLKVESITVCGHSGCGAMQALLDAEPNTGAPQTSLWRWLRHGLPSLERMASRHHPWARISGRLPTDAVEQLCLTNVVQQLDHLRAHEAVAQRLAEGTLHLHGMYFHVGEAQAYLLTEGASAGLALDEVFDRVDPGDAPASGDAPTPTPVGTPAHALASARIPGRADTPGSTTALGEPSGSGGLSGSGEPSGLGGPSGSGEWGRTGV